MIQRRKDEKREGSDDGGVVSEVLVWNAGECMRNLGLS